MSIGREAAPLAPRRGDVVIVAFPDIGGHVQAGTRPGVVVQTDRLGRSGTVVVCPLTSAPPRDERPRPHRVAVRAAESGLDRDSWVKADQPTTVPSAILRGPVGRLSPGALERLDDALRFVFDL